MIKLSALFVGLLAASSVFSQTLEPVIEKSSKINELAAKSQKKIDSISDQIDDKLQKFKSVNKETEGLKIYNAQLRKQIENQIKEMEQLNASIDKVSIIERQITPLMLRMISGLEEFISLDIPFQKEKRMDRVDRLKSTMDRADVSVSEKFRQVLEAYQIELDYGRTLNAYEGLYPINGEEQPVNFLRVGRVALIYQTKDKKTQGIWNQRAGEWQALDSSYSTKISNGIKMAREQMAPDMLTVPVFSAE
ncbi:DUF3450 domain-containing protein [Pleionea sediminis]|uniref:DUF3450 domain-containing protein n=1 Tax=Pleionea sediminis TaxID=2569479 RepID=UPI001185AD8F|nr:DUF3450 domain-containing protein [Pleionea sediminis]